KKTSVVRKKEIAEELRMQLADYAGAKIEVKHFEQGPPIKAPVEVRISGDNLDSLRQLAAQVESILESTEGAIYVNNPLSNLKSDIKVAIQKEKARAMNLNVVDIDRTVRMAIAGLSMGSFTDPDGNKKDIIVTGPKSERATLKSFDHVFVNNMMGQAIPVNQVANLEMESSPLKIDHYNKT